MKNHVELHHEDHPVPPLDAKHHCPGLDNVSSSSISASLTVGRLEVHWIHVDELVLGTYSVLRNFETQRSELTGLEILSLLRHVEENAADETDLVDCSRVSANFDAHDESSGQMMVPSTSWIHVDSEHGVHSTNAGDLTYEDTVILNHEHCLWAQTHIASLSLKHSYSVQEHDTVILNAKHCVVHEKNHVVPIGVHRFGHDTEEVRHL